MGLFLFGAALRDFVRAKRIIVWLLLVAALFGLAKAFLSVNPNTTGEDAYVQLSGILVFRVLALAAAIFSTAVVAQEIEQKTIVYLLTRPVARPLLLVSRWAATVTVVFAIGLLAAAAVSFATFGPSGLSNSIFWRDARALFFGSGAYVSLFLLVSLWMNRSMLVNLLFAFVWESFIPNLPGDVYKLSIFSYLKAIAQRPSSGNSRSAMQVLSGQAGPDLISASTGYVTMILLICVCLAAGCWWFRHFEYLPREDAE